MIEAFQGEKVVNVPLHAKDVNVNIHGKRTINGVNIFENSIKPLPNNDQQPFIVTFINTPPTLVTSSIKVKRKYNFFSIH